MYLPLSIYRPAAPTAVRATRRIRHFTTLPSCSRSCSGRAIIRMSAVVMSNFHSQWRQDNWLLAQMSHYPPPPQPDTQHYSPLYPTSAGAPHLLDPSQQNQLQFSNLNQPTFPAKIESGTPNQDPSQIQSLAQELQHHAVQEEQQRQQIQHAAQSLQQQAQQGQQGFQPQVAQSDASGDQPQKTNRLRKACDSCSIRKVKVRLRLLSYP